MYPRTLIGHALAVLMASSAVAQSSLPVSLTQAIAIARENNPDVLASSHTVDATRGKLWKGISPAMPEVSIDYDYIPKRSPLSEFGERRITFSQSFEFPTSYALKGSLLSSNIDVATAEHQTNLLALTAAVKRAYFQNLGKRAKLTLAEEAMALSVDFARKAEVRFSAGEASNLEALTAKAQLAQAENLVEIARNDLRIADSEFILILGLPEKERKPSFVLTDTLTFHSLNADLEAMQQSALAGNPRIWRQAFLSRAASEGRTLAWSSFLPSFTASYGWQRVGTDNNFYSASFGVSLPLWFMLDQRGQIQEASASHSAAELQLRAARNAVLSNVQTSFYEVKNDERQVLLYQGSIIPQSEEVHRIALRSYEAGESTYLEYLQARQMLITARASYIDLLVAFNTSSANLEFAVGRNDKGTVQ